MNITKELAQAIVQYLATKPYAEVFQLINELQKQSTHTEVTPQTAEEVTE
jgi:hypothetical protein